jgi:hypothetical protein
MPFSAINLPYGNCLVSPEEYPDSTVWGSGKVFPECLPSINSTVYPPLTMEQLSTNGRKAAENMDAEFFKGMNAQPYVDKYYYAYPSSEFVADYAKPDLQEPRRPEDYKNIYVKQAGESLHHLPDLEMGVFFSSDNIEHLRNQVVKIVNEVTGVKILQPNIDDFFNYMLKNYRDYKVYNGSICFVNQDFKGDIKDRMSKLNSALLQDYVSKLVSQIRMYMYYYKDASQLPEQLSLPTYTSMKGSRELEYNTGFSSGDSMAVSAFNQVGNVLY